jgi:hypothetical protein
MNCHPERSEGSAFCWLPQDASDNFVVVMLLTITLYADTR